MSVTQADLDWFEAEAERMGLTVQQLAELAAQGATDALEAQIAQWQRDQTEEEVAA